MSYDDPKDGARFMRGRHDAFVDKHAQRLGVNASAILQSVRDFGLTAQDIRELTDKSGLTRYANGGLNIIGMAPIPVSRIKVPARREFRTPETKAKAKRANRVKVQHEKRTERSSAWPSDRGATSLGQALRRVGFK